MLSAPEQLLSILAKHHHGFHPVVPFDAATEKAVPLDLTTHNTSFTDEIYQHLDTFTSFIDGLRLRERARYLFGGYAENRRMYRRSELFDKNLFEQGPRQEETRSLHLGMDVWGEAGTPVYAPLGGVVHSMAFNDRMGDYGATIILGHQLDGFGFYSLFGHLSREDLAMVREGHFISRGEAFAHFGRAEDNGHWPPHLHFQLIIDIGVHDGDYPGVCKPSEAGRYLSNSPDPALFFPFH
ncbi:MAG: peptidoglycan DD-metalloendopeptidase family protein [Ferruginibacter sp.]|jgi:murein DD-endopeptidase MepM/ murein hydrolase activator NlpD